MGKGKVGGASAWIGVWVGCVGRVGAWVDESGRERSGRHFTMEVTPFASHLEVSGHLGLASDGHLIVIGVEIGVGVGVRVGVGVGVGIGVGLGSGLG